MNTYLYTKKRVPDRGSPPDPFLDELIDTIKALPDEVFAPNARKDIYSVVAGVLGPWRGILHRKAVMAEVLRVLAEFESSCNWFEGVDTTNPNSLKNIEGEETGIFQVSADSMRLDPSLRQFIIERLGSDHPALFIQAMKSDHPLAVEYCARLLRVNTRWDGPITRGEVSKAVSRDAVDEFMRFLG